MYVVVNCPRCGSLILAKTIYRTRSCPHCGYRAELGRLRVLGRASSSTEAVALIQALKDKSIGKGNRRFERGA